MVETIRFPQVKVENAVKNCEKLVRYCGKIV